MISQILIAFPLAILYEFSIWISSIAVKKRQKDLEKAISGKP